MTRLARHLLLCIALLAPVRDGSCADGGVIVIGNPQLPVSSLSTAQLTAIYLHRETLWPGGMVVVAVNQDISSAARRRFSLDVFQQPPEALGEYWTRMHFRGQNPPLVLDSDAAVAAFVQRVPGSVGYVSAGTPVEEVKILKRLP